MSLVQEDELLVPLEADGYLQKLLKQKSLLDHVWSGFKFTCLFLSLVCRAKSWIGQAKGGLISESFIVCLHPPKNVPNHYPELEILNLSLVFKVVKSKLIYSLHALREHTYKAMNLHTDYGHIFT